mmetsp:Transcript_28959/g.35221  ORF Transcript_28959/g.35221 Transcript_28959/m.35221 type:complete len:835 (+) Transcript_28959:239-2743(+)
MKYRNIRKAIVPPTVVLLLTVVLRCDIIGNVRAFSSQQQQSPRPRRQIPMKKQRVALSPASAQGERRRDCHVVCAVGEQPPSSSSDGGTTGTISTVVMRETTDVDVSNEPRVLDPPPAPLRNGMTARRRDERELASSSTTESELFRLVARVISQVIDEFLERDGDDDSRCMRRMEVATDRLWHLSERAGSGINGSDNNTKNDESCRDTRTRPKTISSSKHELATASVLATQSLCDLMHHHGPSRGTARKALISILSSLNYGGDNATTTNALAVASLAAVLSIRTKDVADDEGHRAASRAVVSGLLPTGRHQKRRLKQTGDKEKDYESPVRAVGVANDEDVRLVEVMVLALLDVAAGGNEVKDGGVTTGCVDLHIVATLIRAYNLSNTYCPRITLSASTIIRQQLYLPAKGETKVFYSGDTPHPAVEKVHAAAALNLAAELGPWSLLTPRTLVEIAISFDLWHGAERICLSTISQLDHPSSSATMSAAEDAVRTLIDSASDRHQYRRSDAFATEFYEYGGQSRYVAARYRHACDTICKVVQKRQLKLLERQVERVDRALERTKKDGVTDEDKDFGENCRESIREFVLSRLREVNEHDTAHRLASLWGMEYWYNEEDAEKYVMARKMRYLQWEEAFPGGNVPELISDAAALLKGYSDLKNGMSTSQRGIVGFDVEWGDDYGYDGAALLQLSTKRKAILIDIPALISSQQGCDALQTTVGQVFAGKDDVFSTIVGFSSREDLSRLRASVGVRGRDSNHWFSSWQAFADIKPLIVSQTPVLKQLGLSRICEHYFGKPLDKAEQCSMWLRRPLSVSQRTYAALDAWAVAALWDELHKDS